MKGIWTLESDRPGSGTAPDFLCSCEKLTRGFACKMQLIILPYEEVCMKYSLGPVSQNV